MRTRAKAAVCACAAIGCVPATDARAGVTQLAPGQSIDVGPVLVGDHTVWAESGVFDPTINLRMAAPDGRATTLLRFGGVESCDSIGPIAGSSG